ncbi:MAG: amidophosphoribosyltransferase [Hyphomicrobiales bacterium]|nr:amidophosphoribosyltransferase [Hyphomicrobiales bacterium]
MPDLPPSAAPRDLLLDDDKLHEECGVFGVFGHEDAAALTALGLHALQHRGQEAAGIVSFNNGRFHAERRLGLVSDHFTQAETLAQLPGSAALGHVRYSTFGGTTLRNVQPLFADLAGGGFACAHNGNITNARHVRNELVRAGAIFQSTNDTETILQLVARSQRGRTVPRLIDALFQIQGAYSLVVLTNKKLIGVRDPLGIRPLVLGKLGDAHILASETCALDMIGASFVREVENGEMLVMTEDGLESHKPFPPALARPCIFEYIYFSRPDSMLGGKNVYACRKAFGRELAKENRAWLAALPPKDTLIVPVPDSGVPAALGFAEASGLPFEYGIIRNHYVGRSFIEPRQAIRQFRVKLKHNINRAYVANKRVILIDDSIVRGTTSLKIVQMMRESGAGEVHLRIGCPPIMHPDFYGIDTPERERLLAANHDIAAMQKHIGVDSLDFLSLDGLYRAMGHAQGRNASVPQYTDHCFTGDYPTPLVDYREQDERQLSLLAESR